jgi:hypothetical protein
MSFAPVWQVGYRPVWYKILWIFWGCARFGLMICFNRQKVVLKTKVCGCVVQTIGKSYSAGLQGVRLVCWWGWVIEQAY